VRSSPPAILLVDNSADTLEMYALGLSFAGYRPLTASDANMALYELRQQRPDAVVTEVHLDGGRDGWDLIAEIRNDPSISQIPVVVLTGWVGPSITLNAHRTGCAAILTKPCRPDELTNVLERVLSAVD
jgi:CheY-like chemotaxis protein